MKIILLDRCTVTKGDVDLSPIEKLGDTFSYGLLTKQEIIEVSTGADVIVCNKAIIDREIMEKTGVRFVGVFATGYNNIDIAAAKELGITVCNVPGYSTDSVAQVTASLLLELAGNTSKYTASVANGDWKLSKQFSYFSFPITEIAGKTFGIFGLGTIGRAVAKIALAFNMKVIAYSRTERPCEGVEYVSKERLFKESDFLSFHCPLNEGTRLALNADTLSLMKPAAYVINTSRGGVVDEYAFADALNSGKIAGAGIDVLTVEPMAEECPLFGAKNCIITPHIAWASLEARTRLSFLVARNIEMWSKGTPINTVK